MFTVTPDGRNVGPDVLYNINVSTLNEFKTMVGDAANYAVQTGQGAAHVITGHMRKNIQQEKRSPISIGIMSKAIYAGYENARGGDHAYFDIMYEQTLDKYPQLIFSDIIRIIRNPKITR